MSKKSRSEAQRVVSAIKGNKAEYYVADVDLEDEADEVYETAKIARKTLGKHQCNFMLISAGVKNLTVCVDWKISPPVDSNSDENITPVIQNNLNPVENNRDERNLVNGCDWLNASLKNIVSLHSNDTKISIEIDTPFKLKDIVRANAFAFLKENNFLEEESEEEEFFLE